MEIKIPNGTIDDLYEFEKQILTVIINERTRRQQQVDNAVRKYMQTYLATKLPGFELITDTKNYFNIYKCTSVYDKHYDHTFTWSIGDNKFQIEYNKDNTVTISLSSHGQTIYFTSLITDEWAIANKFNWKLIQLIPEFVKQFAKLKEDTIIMCNNYRKKCEKYPIIQTQNAIICLLQIRKYNESQLSILPKDIVNLIAKILWQDRLKFYK